MSSPTSPFEPEPKRNVPVNAQRLLGIVRSVAQELRPQAPDIRKLTLDQSLDRDFGLDSLARAELLARIEHEYAVKLGEQALLDAETPRDLLRLTELAAGTPPSVDERMRSMWEWPSAEPASPASVADSEEPPGTASTLIDLLDWHVQTHGDRVYITLYAENDRIEPIHYRALQTQAKALAAGLQRKGLNAGDRVAVMLPTGCEFFAAFYGALYAGCIPVPLYPPARPSQLEDHMRRSAGIIANAQAAVLVTVAAGKPLGHLLRAQCESLRMVLTPADLDAASVAPSFAKPKPEDIAFLQYTSGSTGNPKGVVLTHANLLVNLRAMHKVSGVTSADTFVSWLPLYHDMGLIGACMGSLLVGFPLVLMSPTTFLARPAFWLWAIHRYRATISAAPNFAYELCANKLDDRDLAGLDLRSWRLAYNGAEPVSPDTIEKFASRFAPYGFNRAAMTPVYGLAESSLGLAFPPLGRGPRIDLVDRDALSRQGVARPAPEPGRRSIRFVSCGLPLPGHQIRITDASGRELAERAQGHVQFFGPSATAGYYRNSEATSHLFDGAWLDTGDMGYIAAGELYLTGRVKDIIIRAGRHLFPQELEEAVSQVSGVRKGGVAVFAATDVRSGTERLVMLAETRESGAIERSQMLSEINNLAVDLSGVPVDEIVLVPPRTVLKTSSGKLRRSACREMYERGEIGRTQRAPWLQIVHLGFAGAATQLARLAYRASDWLWSAWVWMVFAVLAPLTSLAFVLVPRLAMRRQIARVGARIGFALCGLSPHREGERNIDSPEPIVVVVNHSSYVDALLLTAVLPARFTYVAKRELLLNPVTSILLRRLGCVFVERFDSARGIEETSELEQLVREGQSLVFFPEGTFRREPGLMSFRLGAFLCAAHARSAVIPVTLVGTRSLLRDGQWWPRRAQLRVLIGQPLRASGDDWQTILHLRDAARSAIQSRLGEPDAAS
ncbi:AMP-binding protein [Ralstonia solanacearum]|uniref:AMP-binding protein n=1 Tax=Ralstonia solanacearum TaxID=305 RepID=UPI0009BE47CA|nr:AMP-binding protein [Ralstonia solanacearum]